MGEVWRVRHHKLLRVCVPKTAPTVSTTACCRGRRSGHDLNSGNANLKPRAPSPPGFFPVFIPPQAPGQPHLLDWLSTTPP